jgi:hypothetical protein
MDKPTIPAPGRDFANVEPRLPPASTDESPIARSIMGWFAVTFGAAVILLAILGSMFEAAPLTPAFLGTDDVAAAILTAGAGLCLIGCGFAILRGSTFVTLLLMVGTIILGYSATLVD